MNYRTRVITLSVLLALSALTAAIGALFLPNGVLANRPAFFVRGLDTESVAAIEIRDPLNSVTHRLVRLPAGGDASEAPPAEQGEAAAHQWRYVQGEYRFPARLQQIETLLANLSSLERLRSVTADEDRYPDLGVDSGSARELALFDEAGTEQRRFYFGNDDERDSGSYARSAESATVYLVANDLDFSLEQGAGYWQERRLFAQGRSSIDIDSFSLSSDIALTTGEEPLQHTYTLVRRPPSNPDFPPQWSATDNPDTALDTPRIESLLSSLVALNAHSYAPLTRAESGVDTNLSARIEATVTDGSLLRVLIGNPVSEGGAQYYAVVEGSDQRLDERGRPYVYRVDDWALRSVVQSTEDLLPPPATAQDGG